MAGESPKLASLLAAEAFMDNFELRDAAMNYAVQARPHDQEAVVDLIARADAIRLFLAGHKADESTTSADN